MASFAPETAAAEAATGEPRRAAAATTETLRTFETFGPCDISVGSYNLLAPLYVRPVDLRTGAVQPFAAFDWCSPGDLDWEARVPRLGRHVAACAAACDVLCLQEVQFDPDGYGGFVTPQWLSPALPLDATIVAPPARDLERGAARNLKVLGRAAPVGALVVVSAAWDVVWTAEGNSQTRVLCGVRKGDGPVVAVACARLPSGFRDSLRADDAASKTDVASLSSAAPAGPPRRGLRGEALGARREDRGPGAHAPRRRREPAGFAARASTLASNVARSRRGRSAETRRGDAAAATRIVSVETRRGDAAAADPSAVEKTRPLDDDAGASSSRAT